MEGEDVYKRQKKDCTGDGYTNIEKYINGISTRNCIDWSDLRNNYDTLASKGKLKMCIRDSVWYIQTRWLKTSN